MADRLPEALRQAQEQLLSRGQRISAPDGRIRYDDAFFIRNGEASQILEPHLESVIFGRLIFPSDQERGDFASRILHRPGLAAILLTILAHGSLSMMTTFEHKFLRQSPLCTLSDQDLPFTRTQADEIFGEEGSEFLEIQVKSNAIKLIEGNFEQEYKAENGMPYLNSRLLGQGAFGIVHRVEIECGHYTQIDKHMQNTRVCPPLLREKHDYETLTREQVLPFARKDFDADKESFASFEFENKISRIFHTANPPSSISRPLCSITIKFDDRQFKAASIFSEPANLNLGEYLRQERSHKLNFDERVRNLQQMLHICHGLGWLNHDKKKSLAADSYENASYIHGDLKPENIFIYHEPAASPASQGAVFKIGDFGEAFLLGPSKDKVGNHRPSTQFLFRTGTYRAPELLQGKIDTKSDVWSFGCILLLVLLYNHPDGGGPNAITAFATSRANETGGMNEDVFYQPKRRIFHRYSDVCNKAVTDCIKDMKSDNEQSGNQYAKMATEILDCIRSSILVREDKRADIRKVCDHLENIMQKHLAGTREVQYLEPNAKYSLEFPDSSSVSYCGHAPDGHVFHYSPEQITFFQVDGNVQARVKRRMAGNPKLKWSDEVLPNTRACGNNGICVIQKTTINDPVQLSIRYWDNEKAPTLVRLAEVTRLNGVALSPNEELLAIACDPKTQDRLHARVRMYRVSDFHVMSAPVRSLTTSSDQSFASTTSVPLIETQRDQIKNGEVRKIVPGGHVDLTFSKDGEILYHAHRTRKHQVVVSMWNANGSHLAQSIIEDEDVNDDRIFITEIVPLFNAIGFVAITHEQYIIQRELTTDGRWNKKTFKAVRGLKAIFLAQDNSTVVMLATDDREFLELHMGTLGDAFRPQRIDMRNRFRFVPGQDSAYLSESGDGRLELQVASKKEKQIFKYHFSAVNSC
ncbi:hypothetical protein G7054_g4652 [Neopestalotiopsis clavispora]|nr:hypothetical protein G7054_g4652 [Neopestalotiopsis clavispora]